MAALACLWARLSSLCFASRLAPYAVVKVNQLHVFRQDEFCKDTEDNTRWPLAATNTRALDTLRAGNNSKVTKLEYALIAQIGAFSLLGIAVFVWLLRSVS